MFLITGLNWGGAESQVIDLAVSLRERRWDVSVVCMLPTAARRGALESRGISVYTLGMARGLPDPRGLVRCARLIRKIRPQVAHAHMLHAILLSRVARLFVPIPVLISSEHNMRQGARWRTIAFRVTDSLSDLTTNVCHAAVLSLVDSGAAPKGRIRFMPNGIDLTRFSRDAAVRARVRGELKLDGHFIWLAVGRIEEQKDYPNLLGACTLLAQHPARPLLLIVGEGPLRERTERLADELGIRAFVQFLGLRTDVPDLMASADAYVMSSAWEGLPIVLLEAAASALPIVATDVGGNGQIVSDGISGKLVRPRDSSALAAAMTRMMELPPPTLRQMGEAGSAHARSQFELGMVVDQWEEMYEQLYRRRGTR